MQLSTLQLPGTTSFARSQCARTPFSTHPRPTATRTATHSASSRTPAPPRASHSACWRRRHQAQTDDLVAGQRKDVKDEIDEGGPCLECTVSVELLFWSANIHLFLSFTLGDNNWEANGRNFSLKCVRAWLPCDCELRYKFWRWVDAVFQMEMH